MDALHNNTEYGNLNRRFIFLFHDKLVLHNSSTDLFWRERKHKLFIVQKKA